MKRGKSVTSVKKDGGVFKYMRDCCRAQKVPVNITMLLTVLVFIVVGVESKLFFGSNSVCYTVKVKKKSTDRSVRSGDPVILFGTTVGKVKNVIKTDSCDTICCFDIEIKDSTIQLPHGIQAILNTSDAGVALQFTDSVFNYQKNDTIRCFE